VCLVLLRQVTTTSHSDLTFSGFKQKDVMKRGVRGNKKASYDYLAGKKIVRRNFLSSGGVERLIRSFIIIDVRQGDRPRGPGVGG
jgi:hypothetical protein